MKKLTKIIAIILSLSLLFQQVGFAQIAGTLDISGFMTQLRQSITVDKFRPLHLRYLAYDNINNNFKLLLDKGDLKNLKSGQLEETSKKLLNLFFVGVTLPNDSFWVNLRPDAPDKMIDPMVAMTDVGKVFCEADLQLKKDTAKFTSPDTPEGREYWNKLYERAGQIFGSQNITIPTLTRPWIVPDEIIIRESTDNAYIYKATLKVMLEQDYLKDSSTYNFKDDRLKALNEYSSQLIRELIIPKLTKEINTSKRYASLRQVYYSLIMAQWFKQKFRGKGGLYSWLIDRGSLNGLTSKEEWSKDYYFKEYQKSFQQGEYNFKEPVTTPFGQTIRSYFSGGIAASEMMLQAKIVSSPTPIIGQDGIVASLSYQHISSPINVTGGDVDNLNVKTAKAAESASSPTSTISNPAERWIADYQQRTGRVFMNSSDLTNGILRGEIRGVDFATLFELVYHPNINIRSAAINLLYMFCTYPIPKEGFDHLSPQDFSDALGKDKMRLQQVISEYIAAGRRGDTDALFVLENIGSVRELPEEYFNLIAELTEVHGFSGIGNVAVNSLGSIVIPALSEATVHSFMVAAERRGTEVQKQFVNSLLRKLSLRGQKLEPEVIRFIAQLSFDQADKYGESDQLLYGRLYVIGKQAALGVALPEGTAFILRVLKTKEAILSAKAAAVALGVVAEALAKQGREEELKEILASLSKDFASAGTRQERLHWAVALVELGHAYQLPEATVQQLRELRVGAQEVVRQLHSGTEVVLIRDLPANQEEDKLLMEALYPRQLEVGLTAIAIKGDSEPFFVVHRGIETFGGSGVLASRVASFGLHSHPEIGWVNMPRFIPSESDVEYSLPQSFNEYIWANAGLWKVEPYTAQGRENEVIFIVPGGKRTSINIHKIQAQNKILADLLSSGVEFSVYVNYGQLGAFKSTHQPNKTIRQAYLETSASSPAPGAARQTQVVGQVATEPRAISSSVLPENETLAVIKAIDLASIINEKIDWWRERTSIIKRFSVVVPANLVVYDQVILPDQRVEASHNQKQKIKKNDAENFWRSLLQYVLEELIYNAAQARSGIGIGEVTAINLIARVSGNKAIIEISDNGPGIPGNVTEELEKWKKGEFRDPVSTTKGSGGEGIQLSYRVMNQLGGEMQIETRTKEKFGAESGTTIRLIFPVNAPGPSVSVQSAASSPAPDPEFQAAAETAYENVAKEIKEPANRIYYSQLCEPFSKALNKILGDKGYRSWIVTAKQWGGVSTHDFVIVRDKNGRFWLIDGTWQQFLKQEQLPLNNQKAVMILEISQQSGEVQEKDTEEKFANFGVPSFMSRRLASVVKNKIKEVVTQNAEPPTTISGPAPAASSPAAPTKVYPIQILDYKGFGNWRLERVTGAKGEDAIGDNKLKERAAFDTNGISIGTILRIVTEEHGTYILRVINRNQDSLACDLWRAGVEGIMLHFDGRELPLGVRTDKFGTGPSTVFWAKWATPKPENESVITLPFIDDTLKNETAKISLKDMTVTEIECWLPALDDSAVRLRGELTEHSERGAPQEDYYTALIIRPESDPFNNLVRWLENADDKGNIAIDGRPVQGLREKGIWTQEGHIYDANAEYQIRFFRETLKDNQPVFGGMNGGFPGAANGVGVIKADENKQVVVPIYGIEIIADNNVVMHDLIVALESAYDLEGEAEEGAILARKGYPEQKLHIVTKDFYLSLGGIPAASSPVQNHWLRTSAYTALMALPTLAGLYFLLRDVPGEEVATIAPPAQPAAMQQPAVAQIVPQQIAELEKTLNEREDMKAYDAARELVKMVQAGDPAALAALSRLLNDNNFSAYTAATQLRLGKEELLIGLYVKAAATGSEHGISELLRVAEFNGRSSAQRGIDQLAKSGNKYFFAHIANAEVLKLRNLHLDPRVRLPSAGVAAELHKNKYSANPLFLVSCFTSPENFTDLAGIILDDLGKQAERKGLDVLSFVKQSDVSGTMLKDFILSAAHFNRLHGLISASRSWSLRGITDTVFNGMSSPEEWEHHAARLGLFVEDMCADRAFSQEFQRNLFSMYNNAKGRQQEYLAALLVAEQIRFDKSYSSQIDAIRIKHNIPQPQTTIDFGKLLKNGELVSHILFMDSDAVPFLDAAKAFLLQKNQGYKEDATSTPERVVLRKGIIKVVLINATGSQQENFWESMGQASFISTRGHGGTLTKTIGSRIREAQLNSSGRILYPSECHSVGSMSLGADMANVGVAQGAHSTLLTYVLLDELGETVRRGDATTDWRDITKNMQRRLPAIMRNIVTRGDSAAVFLDMVRAINARTPAASSPAASSPTQIRTLAESEQIADSIIKKNQEVGLMGESLEKGFVKSYRHHRELIEREMPPNFAQPNPAITSWNRTILALTDVNYIFGWLVGKVSVPEVLDRFADSSIFPENLSLPDKQAIINTVLSPESRAFFDSRGNVVNMKDYLMDYYRTLGIAVDIKFITMGGALKNDVQKRLLLCGLSAQDADEASRILNNRGIEGLEVDPRFRKVAASLQHIYHDKTVVPLISFSYQGKSSENVVLAVNIDPGARINSSLTGPRADGKGQMTFISFSDRPDLYTIKSIMGNLIHEIDHKVMKLTSLEDFSRGDIFSEGAAEQAESAFMELQRVHIISRIEAAGFDYYEYNRLLEWQSDPNPQTVPYVVGGLLASGYRLVYGTDNFFNMFYRTANTDRAGLVDSFKVKVEQLLEPKRELYRGALRDVDLLSGSSSAGASSSLPAASSPTAAPRVYYEPIAGNMYQILAEDEKGGKPVAVGKMEFESGIGSGQAEQAVLYNIRISKSGLGYGSALIATLAARATRYFSEAAHPFMIANVENPAIYEMASKVLEPTSMEVWASDFYSGVPTLKWVPYGSDAFEAIVHGKTRMSFSEDDGEVYVRPFQLRGTAKAELVGSSPVTDADLKLRLPLLTSVFKISGVTGDCSIEPSFLQEDIPLNETREILLTREASGKLREVLGTCRFEKIKHRNSIVFRIVGLTVQEGVQGRGIEDLLAAKVSDISIWDNTPTQIGESINRGVVQIMPNALTRPVETAARQAVLQHMGFTPLPDVARSLPAGDREEDTLVWELDKASALSLINESKKVFLGMPKASSPASSPASKEGPSGENKLPVVSFRELKFNVFTHDVFVDGISNSVGKVRIIEDPEERNIALTSVTIDSFFFRRGYATAVVKYWAEEGEKRFKGSEHPFAIKDIRNPWIWEIAEKLLDPNTMEMSFVSFHGWSGWRPAKELRKMATDPDNIKKDFDARFQRETFQYNTPFSVRGKLKSSSPSSSPGSASLPDINIPRETANAADQMGAKKGDKVLLMGYRYTKLPTALGMRGVKATLVDFNPDVIRMERLLAAPLNVNDGQVSPDFINKYAEDISREDAPLDSFDIVSLLDLFIDTQGDPYATIRVALQRVKDGGIVYLPDEISWRDTVSGMAKKENTEKLVLNRLCAELGYSYEVIPGKFVQGDQTNQAYRINKHKTQPVASSPTEKGGIDLRALPITVQPMPQSRIPAPMVPNISAKPDKEWLEIQNMMASGITPSGERLKSYIEKCAETQDVNKILSCLADILRTEEDNVVMTDPGLIKFLTLLESGKNSQEMKQELAKINFAPQEPELVE